VCALFFYTRGFAQGLLGSGPDDPTEILHQLAGSNFAFSANARLSVSGETNSVTVDLSYAVLNTKIRTDFVISDNPALGFRPENLAKVKHCGFDRTTAIMTPDKFFYIYTNWQAWVESTYQFTNTQFTIRKTQLDREVIDGHQCVKYDVFASGGGRYVTAMVWLASDMDGFPVRMDWKNEEGLNWRLLFSNINIRPPKPELFEIPDGYKRYSGINELVKAVCPEAIVEKQK
jgi:hypothetical protein